MGKAVLNDRAEMVQPGESTGIKDDNPYDGVPDVDRFIDGAVRIVCKGVGDKLVEAIMEANRTGQIGDGKIFVLPVSGAMQVGAESSQQLEVTCV